MILLIIRARAGNLQGPYCFSNDYLLGPEQVSTCEVPVVFQMIIIRARAGNLQGHYCFSKDYLLGPEQVLTCEVPIVFQRIIYLFLGF